MKQWKYSIACFCLLECMTLLDSFTFFNRIYIICSCLLSLLNLTSYISHAIFLVK